MLGRISESSLGLGEIGCEKGVIHICSFLSKKLFCACDTVMNSARFRVILISQLNVLVSHDKYSNGIFG